jgi:hypothetical protein
MLVVPRRPVVVNALRCHDNNIFVYDTIVSLYIIIVIIVIIIT